MEEFVFLSVSCFLRASEIGRYCATSRPLFERYETDVSALRLTRLSSSSTILTGTARCIAVDILTSWWRRQCLQKWMDRVAWESVRFHAFPNRFNTNYEHWMSHFGHGLVSIPRIMKTVRFTPRLSKTLRCPCCKNGPIEAAWYRRFGDKMARSTPHIDVGCASCSRFLGCSGLQELYDTCNGALLTCHLRSSINYTSRLTWLDAVFDERW